MPRVKVELVQILKLCKIAKITEFIDVFHKNKNCNTMLLIQCKVHKQPSFYKYVIFSVFEHQRFFKEFPLECSLNVTNMLPHLQSLLRRVGETGKYTFVGRLLLSCINFTLRTVSSEGPGERQVNIEEALLLREVQTGLLYLLIFEINMKTFWGDIINVIAVKVFCVRINDAIYESVQKHYYNYRPL